MRSSAIVILILTLTATACSPGDDDRAESVPATSEPGSARSTTSIWAELGIEAAELHAFCAKHEGLEPVGYLDDHRPEVRVDSPTWEMFLRANAPLRGRELVSTCFLAAYAKSSQPYSEAWRDAVGLPACVDTITTEHSLVCLVAPGDPSGLQTWGVRVLPSGEIALLNLVVRGPIEPVHPRLRREDYLWEKHRPATPTANGIPEGVTVQIDAARVWYGSDPGLRDMRPNAKSDADEEMLREIVASLELKADHGRPVVKFDVARDVPWRRVSKLASRIQPYADIALVADAPSQRPFRRFGHHMVFRPQTIDVDVYLRSDRRVTIVHGVDPERHGDWSDLRRLVDGYEPGAEVRLTAEQDVLYGDVFDAVATLQPNRVSFAR